MICLSICFLLFSPSPVPPLLLPSSSPYQFSPSPFSLIRGYYISRRIRLASLTEIVWPFVSLLYWCGGRWSGQMLHVTIQGPGPLTLLILISKSCCSCSIGKGSSRQGNLVQLTGKWERRECATPFMLIQLHRSQSTHWLPQLHRKLRNAVLHSVDLCLAPAFVAIAVVGNNQQSLCGWLGFVHDVRKGEDKNK